MYPTILLLLPIVFSILLGIASSYLDALIKKEEAPEHSNELYPVLLSTNAMHVISWLVSSAYLLLTMGAIAGFIYFLIGWDLGNKLQIYIVNPRISELCSRFYKPLTGAFYISIAALLYFEYLA